MSERDSFRDLHGAMLHPGPLGPDMEDLAIRWVEGFGADGPAVLTRIWRAAPPDEDWWLFTLHQVMEQAVQIRPELYAGLAADLAADPVTSALGLNALFFGTIKVPDLYLPLIPPLVKMWASNVSALNRDQVAYLGQAAARAGILGDYPDLLAAYAAETERLRLELLERGIEVPESVYSGLRLTQLQPETRKT